MNRQQPRRYGQGSPVGDQIRNNVAKQDLGSIMRPDPEIGTQDAGKSLAALRNGDYQGLEGIQFGVMYGNNVAILPDGHAVVISAGEAIKGITERNKRRTQIAEQMAYDEDVKHFAETNRRTMQQLVDGFEFAPSIAGGYMSLYEQAPMETMQELLQFDRGQRELATKNLMSRQRSARNNTINNSLSMMAKNAKGSGASAEDAGRLQVGVGHLRNFAIRAAPLDDLNQALTDPAALAELQMALQGISPGTLSKAKRSYIDNQRDAKFVGEPYEMNPQQDYPALHDALRSMFTSGGMANAIDLNVAVAAVLEAEDVVIDPSSVRAHGRLEISSRLGKYRTPNKSAERKAFEKDDTNVPDRFKLDDDNNYVDATGKKYTLEEVRADIEKRDFITRTMELSDQFAIYNELPEKYRRMKEEGSEAQRQMVELLFYYESILDGNREAVESLKRMEESAGDVRRKLRTVLQAAGFDV